MATILEFRVSEKQARKAQKRRRRPAEIVIFPGIRYERWEQTPAGAATASVGVVRDTLKIVD